AVATAAAARSAESAARSAEAATAATATLWSEGKRLVRGRPCAGAGRDIRDELGALLNLAVDQLRHLSVGNANPYPNRVDLFVRVDEDSAHALRPGERSKERVDRSRAVCLCGGLCDWRRG